MAITMRIGKESEFDPNKMVPGEWAVSTDTRYVRMCFAPGIVMRMATYESFESDMAQIRTILAECKSIQSAIQRIQSEVNAKASITIEYANAAAESAEKAAESEAKAKMYAENAEAVTGIKIATQTTAGIIKGGENYIDESGELQLTKRTDSPTLYNSYAGGIKLNELGGACEQFSTTGAQLFDADARTSGVNISTSSGNTYGDSNAFATAYIAVNGFTNIVTNMQSDSNGYVWGVFYDESKSMISAFNKTATGENTFEVPTDAYYVRIGCLNTLLDTAIVASGTVLPDWEPYTGNAPSPSPEYPQEIKSVEVKEIKAVGKNLLASSKVVEKTINGVTFTPVRDADGKLLYIEANGTATDRAWIGIGVSLEAGEYIANGVSGGSNSTYYIFGMTADDWQYAFGNTSNGDKKFMFDRTRLISYRMNIASGATANGVKFYPMIRKADVTDDTYEPYTEQSHTLSKPIKLNGVGTAQDRFVRKDGVWKIERNAYEIVANSLTEFNTAYGCGYVSIPKGTVKTQNWNVAEENAMSNIFNNMISINTLINNSDREELAIYTPSATDPREGVIFRITSIEQTEEAYNAFLAETPLVVLVELAVPTYEDLPTADQTALNSLVSYDGITYLYCDSEVQPTWDLEYGTSRVGGYTLEAWNTAMSEKILNESRYNEIVAAMLVMNQG